MGTIVLIHTQLSQTIWVFFLVLGLWGLFRAIRGQAVDGSYMGALVIGQILYVVQGVLGGILWLNGNMVLVARPFMHVLYGSFALVFLPFVFMVWLRGDDSNRGQWVLAFTVLFMFGIALRATSTV
ncbi:MAG: hypothetical protein IPM39_01280 [Chloroflexi bacterium]|nr:hypothetical protein [Chloroflexota bacterium]